MSDGGDPYTGYDRFSRTQRSLWLKDTGTELEPLVDVAWGYDQASLRTWRRDRSPGAPEEHQDQAFSYDELYQLTQRQRGNLNVNKTSVNGYAKAAEDFDYDQQGNWNQYQTHEDGQPVIDQSRAHNESNQITKIDGTSAIIAHDANGNTVLVPTSDPNGPQGNLEGEPVKVIWDAWNRSRKVLDETDQVIWENQYDALTRRIITDDGTAPRHYYFNDQWRCVEERLGTSTNAERQHVWNPSDRWDLILRDRDSTANGTLDERLYCIKDDLDPVAIADTTGDIVERYSYTAFGIPNILNADFQPRSGNQSDFAWNFLFHGEFTDEVTGWMNYGYRFYVPALGRWLARDPIGERGSLNGYQYPGNNAAILMDFLGLTEIWTFSGINSFAPREDGGEIEDYVDKSLQKGGFPAADKSHSSMAGTGWPYNAPDQDDYVSVANLSSERILNNEASSMAQDRVEESELCCKRIRVLMIAPKTTTRLPKNSCCSHEAVVYWSPADAVPNQRHRLIGNTESAEYWSQWGRVYTVDTRPRSPGGSFGNHNFAAFMGEGPSVEVKRSRRPGQRRRDHTTNSRRTIQPTGSVAPDPLSYVTQWQSDNSVDIIMICHSQGCNIAMHLLNRGCKPEATS